MAAGGRAGRIIKYLSSVYFRMAVACLVLGRLAPCWGGVIPISDTSHMADVIHSNTKTIAVI